MDEAWSSGAEPEPEEPKSEAEAAPVEDAASVDAVSDEPPASSASPPPSSAASAAGAVGGSSPASDKRLPARGMRSRPPRPSPAANSPVAPNSPALNSPVAPNSPAPNSPAPNSPAPNSPGRPPFGRNVPSYQSVSAVLEDTARVPAKQADGARRMIRRETDTAVKSPEVLSDGSLAEDEDTERNDKRPPARTMSTSPSVRSFSDLPDKTAALPSIADATGSTTPYESHAELAASSSSPALRAAGIAPRKYPAGRPGATARALHEEDEDGPTMVAPIPPEVAHHSPSRPGRPGAPPPDDEATQVHPFRLPAQPVTQPPPPMAGSTPPSSLPPHSQPSISLPSPRDPIPTAPPPVMAPPSHANTAIQAAIDAAAMMSVEGKMLEDRKSRSFDTLAASSLGVGMITASLASYLAARSTEQSPSYFGIVALTTIAMFVIGLGPLQPRNETKLSFIALGGVMLGFTLLGLLIVALS